MDKKYCKTRPNVTNAINSNLVPITKHILPYRISNWSQLPDR